MIGSSSSLSRILSATAVFVFALSAQARAGDTLSGLSCEQYVIGHRYGIFPYVDDPVLANAERKKVLGFMQVCHLADYVATVCLQHPDYSVRRALDEVDLIYRTSGLACDRQSLPGFGSFGLVLPDWLSGL